MTLGNIELNKILTMSETFNMLLCRAPVQEGGTDYEWVTMFAASLLLLVKAASLSTEKAPSPSLPAY